MSDLRQNPEESLKKIQNDEEKSKLGKLKIYLGAAPGVGKTYTMLHDAYERRKKKLDVVIGIVESHGREDIKSQLNKFEIIPRGEVSYRDSKYLEFDLDATLLRNPGLVLVDEMAHTNIPGLRHDKRWQDIKELLDRGIDVYTTLNVQHIESLKDDVAKIINAPIKETIPDFMLELADTIELVDLPVDDLLKRLQDGKIYIPEQLEQAVDNYFRRGNLIALRELALRATATYVENEVLSYRKSAGIKEIWPTKEKILVCVCGNPEDLKVIRTAKRMITSLQGEWIAVYVDDNRLYSFKKKRNNAIYNLKLAQQLGAKTHVLIGNNIVKEILEFAHENNITQIIIWKDVSHNFRNLFRKHLADEILAKSNEINVLIITGTSSSQKIEDLAKIKRNHLKYYFISLSLIAGLTLINWFLSPYLDRSSLIMIYLLGVTRVASFGYIGPAIFTSITSVFAFDFFFLEPINGYAILNSRNISTLVAMLLISHVISYLTLSKHREAKFATKMQKQTRELYSFSRELLSTYGLDNLLALGSGYIGEIFKAEVIAFIPNNHKIAIRERGAFKEIPDLKEESIAQWVYDLGQPAGYGTDTLSSADALYLPLIASKKTIGVLKVQPKNKALYSPEQMVLLESCVHQLTLALEVDRLQEKYHQKALQAEIESAKDTVLKTISYNLNYPLNAIFKTISAYPDKKENIDRELISKELSKVSLINNNIIQMIGFEAQPIFLNKQQISLIDLLNLAISNLKIRFQSKKINLNSPHKSIYIFADNNLLKKVFDNILDNANKFSPKDSEINIFIYTKDRKIRIRVENISENISKDDVSKLFKKFYRGKNISNEDGLGIGLTICQIIIEAHEGLIWADVLEEKKTVSFNIVLPMNI